VVPGKVPEPARAAQLEPRVVRYGSGAGSIPGATIEDQHRLHGRGYVGGSGRIEAAAVCARSCLEFVPQQPGTELPAYRACNLNGVGGHRLPAAAVAIERDVQAEPAPSVLCDTIEFGEPRL